MVLEGLCPTTLLEAMQQVCDDITVESCQGWVWHNRGFFPCCLARENIACGVEEVRWPNPIQRHDVISLDDD